VECLLVEFVLGGPFEEGIAKIVISHNVDEWDCPSSEKWLHNVVVVSVPLLVHVTSLNTVTTVYHEVSAVVVSVLNLSNDIPECTVSHLIVRNPNHLKKVFCGKK